MRKSRRVVITGLGVVAPNGIGKNAFWEALVAGKSGIDYITSFDATPYPCQVAAEVKDFRPTDFMDSGGELTIRVADLSQGGGSALIVEVSDTGCGIPEGMPEHVRKRIFDPFFTTKGEVGTGLGLSVSYSIIQRHGGEMRAESQPGRGTTFTIVLPVGTAEKNPPPADSEALGTRRGRILLVDNELPVMVPENQALYSRTDAANGHLRRYHRDELLRIFLPCAPETLFDYGFPFMPIVSR